ncbi:MAG: hypothetical protein K8R92_09805 [Planctomycetes bacterium]|nr:hypothetical protein [Planctomycetota bacterium]
MQSMRSLGLFGVVVMAVLAGAASVKPPVPPKQQVGGGSAIPAGDPAPAEEIFRPSILGGLPAQFTTVSVKNATAQRQYFYIVLTPVSVSNPSYPHSEEIFNLGQVAFTGSFASGEGVITPTNGPMGTATQGHFFLNAGNTASFAPHLTFSANFYVNGTAGTNNSQCITDVTQGVGIGATFAEVTLNVDSRYLGGEVVDISEVNGVNALWEMTLPIPAGNLSMAPPNGHYPYFFSTSGYLFPAQTTVPNWGTFGANQLIPVPSIANNPGAAPTFSGDRNATLPYGAGHGTVGVYPFGCDNCISRDQPGCTGSYPAANLVEQTKEICQVYRAAQYQTGGNVGIILKQFPYP